MTQIDAKAVPEGEIRWYKVAAFNSVVDTGTISTSNVYGYALMSAPSNLNCWEAEAVDSIRVTWTKIPNVYKKYYLQWALDTTSNSNGTFVNPLGEKGDYDYSTSTFARDSFTIPINVDSLRGRRIYVKLWAQNDYGRSEPALDSGYTRLSALANLSVSKGLIKDSLKISFTKPTNSNISSFTLQVDTLGSDFASPEHSTTSMAGTDTILRVNKAGYYYKVGVSANSLLSGAGSDTIWDSGYSRIPAPVGVGGEALNTGNNKITWTKGYLGLNEEISYSIYRKDDQNVVTTVIHMYSDGSTGTIASYIDSSSLPGYHYEYYLKAYASSRPSNSSVSIVSDTSVHVGVDTKIGMVSNFVQDTADIRQTSATLYWSQRGELVDYEIWYSRYADTTTAKKIDVTISDKNFTTEISDSLADFPGMLWHFWIKAKTSGGNTGGWSPDNNKGLLVYTLPTVSIVDSVSAGESADTIYVRWTKSKYSKFTLAYRNNSATIWEYLSVGTDTTAKLSKVTHSLTRGEQYIFKVNASIDSNSVSPEGATHGNYGRYLESGYSESKSGYLKYDTVSNFRVYNQADSIKDDRINLYWDREAGSNVSYVLYRSTVDDITQTSLLSTFTLKDVGYYQDIRANDQSDPLPGTAYYYWIIAKKDYLVNSEGPKKRVRGYASGAYNGVDSAWTKFIAPSNLTASGVFYSSTMKNDKNISYTDSIVIYWDKMNNVDSFRLQGSIGSTVYLDTFVSDTSVCWKGMERGKVYSFKVCAFNSFVGKDSPKWSDAVTGFAMLKPPTSVTLEQDTANSGVRISFDTVKLAEKYIVYSGSSSSVFAKLFEVAHANQSRLDTFDNTLSPGQKVWYYVTAYNNATGGSDSSEVVDTFCPVSPPNGLSASKGTRISGVYVTWNLDRFTKGVDSFRLYRDTLAGSWAEEDHIITVKSYEGQIVETNDVLGAISSGSDTLFSGRKYKYALRSFANGYESKYTIDENVDTGWVALPDVSKVRGTFVDAGTAKINLYFTVNNLVDKNTRYVYRRIRTKKGNLDTIFVTTLLISDSIVEDDTNLEEGMAYSYEFKAYNSNYIGLAAHGDASVWSNKTGASLGSVGMISADWSLLTYGGKKFATPTIHAVSNLDSIKVDTIKLSWISDSLVTYYKFLRDTTMAFTSPVTFGLTNNALRSSDSYFYAPVEGLEKTQVYYFKMQKQNQEYEMTAWDSLSSPWSAIDSSWSKLIPPTSVSATTKLMDSIKVTWNKYSWKDTVNYVVVYKKPDGTWKDSTVGNVNSLKFESRYIDGEKQIGVYTKHDKFGTSDTSYPLVIGMGKIEAPIFSDRPTQGRYLDSIVMVMNEAEVSSEKTKYRMYYSTDKTSPEISSIDPDYGEYVSSDSNRLVFKSGSGLYSDGYGAKIYFRVSWSLGSVYSEKSEIDSGWTKLKTPGNFQSSSLEDPLDTMAIKLIWSNPSNVDTIKVYKTRASVNTFALYKSVVTSGSNGSFIDTIAEADRRKSYYYKIKAANKLDSTESEFTDSVKVYVNVYNITNFLATDGEKRDTVELSWTADLDTSFTIRVFDGNNYSTQVDSIKNLKTSEGKSWIPNKTTTFPGQWYYFRINLEGDENNPIVKFASIDSGYALIPEIGRDSVIITNDTSLIKLGTDSTNVGDSAFTQFDATGAFNLNYIKNVYISKYNTIKGLFDTIDTLTSGKRISKDLDLTFGKINRYSLKFVNQVSTGFEREYYSFSTLRKPATPTWSSDDLSFSQIKLKVSKGNNDDGLIDSIILYREDSKGNRDTLKYAYSSGMDPNVVIDTFGLTQALFYSYKAAFYNNKTGISRVCDSVDSVYAKLQAPVFDSISKGVDKDTIYIRWKSVSDASKGYRLYYNDNYPTESFRLLKIFGSNTDTFCKDSSVYEQCQNIYYRLLAVGEDTTSLLSDCILDYGSRAFRGVKDLVSKNVPQLTKVELDFSVPPSISLSNPSPAENFNKGVQLMRYDTISNIDSTNTKFSPNFTATINGGGSYSLIDKDSLLIGQLYFYRVLAKSSSSVTYSDLSNIAKGYILPPAVTGVSASSGAKIDTVVLNWTKIVASSLLKDTVDAQIIYRSQDGFSSYDSIIIGGKDSTFEDYDTRMTTLLQPGHNYSYKIKAVVKINEADTGGGIFDTTLYSTFSNVGSGWAQIGSLTASQVTVVKNDNSGINELYPPANSSDSVINIQFTGLPSYVTYLNIYRKSLDVGQFILADTLHTLGATTLNYYDTVTGSRNRGEILQYRIKMGADYEAEAYYDTVSYTNLQPVVSIITLDYDTSEIKFMVTIADNSYRVADSVLLSRYSLTDVRQDSFFTEVTGRLVTITDTGGNSGTLYKYKAALYNSATGYCPYGDAVDTIGKVILPPNFVSISKGVYEDSIYLVWSKNEYATGGYIIYRDTSGVTGSVDSLYDSLCLSPGVNDTSYADTRNYPASKHIYYKVMSVGENTKSAKSAKDYGYLKYKGIKDLVVKGWSENMSTDSMQMTWTMPTALSIDSIFISRLLKSDSSANLDTLDAYRLENSKIASRITSIANGDYTNYKYLNTSVKSELLLGQLYFYRIRVKIEGVSEASTPSNLGIGYLNLPKVENVYATVGEGDSIVVSWTKLPMVKNEKVDSYRVYRSDGNMISIPGDSAEVTDYSVGTSRFGVLLIKGANYKYAVMAKMTINQDTSVGGVSDAFVKELLSPISDSALGYTFPDTAVLESVTRGTVQDTIVIGYRTPENADTIMLYRKLYSDESWPASALSGLLGNVTTTAYYKDSTIETGVLYQYRILVKKGIVEKYTKIDSGYSLLGAPDSVLIANNGEIGDLIKLKVFSPNVQEYQDSIVVHKVSVTMNNKDSIAYRVEAPLSANMYIVNDTHNIHQGVFYEYKVCFTNELGSSSYTTAKNTKAFAKLNVPNLVRVSVREFEDSIKVMWNKVNHADKGYVIWADSTLNTDGTVSSAYLIIDSTDSAIDTSYNDSLYYLPEQKVYYKVQAFGYDTTSLLSSADWGTRKYDGLDSLFIDTVNPKVDTIYFSWVIPTSIVNPQFAFYKYDSVSKVDSITDEYKMSGVASYKVPGTDTLYYAMDTPSDNDLTVGNLYFYRCVVSISSVASNASKPKYGFLAMPNVKGFSASAGGTYATEFVPYQDSIILSWDRVRYFKNGESPTYILTKYDTSGVVLGSIRTTDSIYVDTVGGTSFGTTIERGQNYKYDIRAEYVIKETIINGESNHTILSKDSVMVVGYTFPDSAYILSASLGTITDTIKIEYTTPKYADSIVLYRTNSGNIPSRVDTLKINASTTTEFLDSSTTLLANSEYVYQIRVYKNGLINYSNLDTGYIKLAPPDSVWWEKKDQYADGYLDTSEIVIKWNYEKNAHGYWVYLAKSSLLANFDPIDSVESPSEYDTVLEYKPKDFLGRADSIYDYYFVVKSYVKSLKGNLRYSDLSMEDSGVIASQSVVGISAEYNSTKDSIVVSWAGLREFYKRSEVDSYVVYQAANTKKGVFATVASTSDSLATSIAIDSALVSPGNFYYYKVKVYYSNDKRASVYSPVTSQDVYLPLGKANLRISKDETNLSVVFDTIEGVSSYKLYRYVDTLPTTSSVLNSWTNTQAASVAVGDSVTWTDGTVLNGKIYYYGLVAESVVNVDGEDKTMSTKFGFTPVDRKYGYIKSTFSSVDFDFIAGGVKLFWSQGLNFRDGVIPDGYDLTRKITPEVDTFVDISDKVTKQTVTDDVIITIKDSGTGLFATAKEIGKQYRYLLRAKIISRLQDTMHIVSDSMDMLYDYRWSNDSSRTNTAYSASLGKYTNKIVFRFTQFNPYRDTSDYDTVGITPDTVSYYVVARYLEDSLGRYLEEDRDTVNVKELSVITSTGLNEYYIDDNADDQIFPTELKEAKKYVYSVQGVIDYGSGTVFRSKVIKDSTDGTKDYYGYLKMEGPNLTDIDYILENSVRYGIKLKWEKPSTEGYAYIIGRDTLSTFENQDDNYEPAAMATVLGIGDLILGDTMFLDSNVTNSPLGKTSMGTRYFYRIKKGVLNAPKDDTMYTSWSNTLYRTYGLVNGKYNITTASEFIDLAEQISKGKVSGSISVELANDITFEGVDSLVAMGSPENPFIGEFNGNGHTVTVSVVDLNRIRIGLFGSTNSATIKNLKIIYTTSVVTTSAKYFGGLVAELTGNTTISDVVVTFNDSVSGVDYVGGLIGGGSGTGTLIKDSVYLNKNIIGKSYVGGLAGELTGYSSVDSCKVLAGSSTNLYTNAVGGGFIGTFWGAITNSEVDIAGGLKIKSGIAGTEVRLGGFVGFDRDGSSYKNITATNLPTIEAGFSDVSIATVGGFIGYSKAALISNISIGSIKSVKGVASGDVHVGGLVGMFDYTSGYMEKFNIQGCDSLVANSTSGIACVGIVAGRTKNIRSSLSIGSTNDSIKLSLAPNKYLSATSTNSNIHIGGVVGCSKALSLGNVKIDSVQFKASAPKGYVGGAVGYETATGSKYTDVDVRSNVAFNSGLSSVTNLFAGGLTGYANSSTTSGCNVVANFDFSDPAFANRKVYMGGVYGYASSSNVNVTAVEKLSLKSFAFAVGDSSAVGGYAGYLEANTFTIDTSSISQFEFSSTSVNTAGDSSAVGGIAGICVSTNRLNIDYKGTIDLLVAGGEKSAVGGMFGKLSASVGAILVDTSTGGISISTGTSSAGTDAYYGGLVGHAYSGSLSGFKVRATIEGGKIVGGLVGKLSNNTNLSTSYADSLVTIKGGTYVGGLVGELASDDITTGISKSYVYDINTSGTLGGVGLLVGKLTQGLISSSYALGNKIDRDDAGSNAQFVGNMIAGKIINSYAIHNKVKVGAADYTEITNKVGAYTAGDTSGAFIAENRILMSEDITGNENYELRNLYSYPILIDNVREIDTSILSNSLKMDKNGEGYYIVTKPIQLDAIGDVRLVAKDYLKVNSTVFPAGLRLVDSFVLGNDLDFSGYVGYSPIGYANYSKAFMGSLSGAEFTIKGLDLSYNNFGINSGYPHRALVGYFAGDKIEKLRLSKAKISITLGDMSAVVCGKLESGIIDQVQVDSADIKIASGKNIAIVCGEQTGGTIQNVNTINNNITGLRAVGTLIGKMTGGRLITSIASADSVITSVGNVGGIVAEQAGGTINKVYSSARLLKGANIYKVSSLGSGSVDSAYSLAETNLVTDADTSWVIGTGKTTANGKNLFLHVTRAADIFANLALGTSEWTTSTLSTAYRTIPALKIFNSSSFEIGVTEISGALGIPEKTMEISTPTALAFVSSYSTLSAVDSFVVTKNITFTDNDDFYEGDGNFEPIAPLDGKVFSGKGHVIKNIKIVTTDGTSGLISEIKGTAVVENLGLINCEVVDSSAGATVGTLVGNVTSGTIRDIYLASCRVVGTASGSSVGGVIGKSVSSDCDRLIALNTVLSGDEANSNVGGIVGSVSSGTFDDVVAFNKTLVGKTTGRISGNGGIPGGTIGGAYAWIIDSIGNGTAGLSGTSGKSIDFPTILDSSFYANFISATTGAWSWAEDKEDWQCAPVLTGMSIEDASPEVLRFSAGDGSSNMPFTIVSLEQLNLVRAFAQSGKYFIMKGNVNCDTVDFDDATNGNWVPIGGKDGYFLGNFDGNGYSVSNMKIENVNTAGLFRSIGKAGVTDAEVKYLSIYGAEIAHTGALVAGVLSPYNYGKIRNVLVKDSKVSSSSGTAIGSILGQNINEITSSLSAGNSLSGQTVGGIVGSNTGSLKYCSSIADSITYTTSGGRVVGSNSGGSLEGNFAYRNAIVNGEIVPSNLTGKTTVHGKSISLLAYNSDHFDSYVILDMVDNFRWPVTSAPNDVFVPAGKWVPNSIDSGYVDFGVPNPKTFAGGDGSYFAPYQVQTVADLNNIKYGPEMYFKMIANIVDTHGHIVPIGTDTIPFEGWFDGNYHYISGITNNIVATDGVSGLFGKIKATTSGMVIKNLAIMNSTINGGAKNSVGPFAGEDESPSEYAYTYENLLSYNNKVTTTGDSVGGIIGRAPEAKFTNCLTVNGYLQANSYVGGISAKVKDLSYCGVIMDSMKVTNSSGIINRLAEVVDASANNGFAWYFNRVLKSTSVQTPPSSDSYGASTGNNVIVADFVDSTYWQGKNFTRANGWIASTTKEFQIAPSLKNMNYDSIVLSRLQFSSGEGTLASPYQITTKRELNFLHYFVEGNPLADKYVEVRLPSYSDSNVIDLSVFATDWESDLNGSEAGNWRPVDDFKGYLNFNLGGVTGLDVQHYCIDGESECNQGFFASVVGGSITGMGVYNSSFSGATNERGNVGAVIGKLVNGSVEAVVSRNNLIVNGTAIGGLIGRVKAGTVAQGISVINTIRTGHYVGGGIGVYEGGTLSSIAAMSNTLFSPNSTTVNTILGYGSVSTLICDSTLTTIGGGYGDSPSLSDGKLYYMVDHIGDNDMWTDNGFNSTTYFRNLTGDPIRNIFTLKKVPLNIDNGIIGTLRGKGTIDNPYQIVSPRTLMQVGYRKYVQGPYYFIQLADIDMSGTEDFWPIGTAGDNPYNATLDGFSGYYNGNGYRISGLHLVDNSKEYAGLFAKTVGESDTIRNVVLDSATIEGTRYVGGVLAYQGTGGTVKDCRVFWSKLTQTTATGGIGGIVGYSASTVTRCLSVNNTLTGNSTYTIGMGGIVGVGSNAIISKNAVVGALVVGEYNGYAGRILGSGSATYIDNYSWEGVMVRD